MKPTKDAKRQKRWQFWIDRGGTFTDCLGRDPDTGKIREVKSRFNASSLEVVGDGHKIDIPRPLAMAEQSPFDTVGAGEGGEFRRGDGHALVIVGMKRDKRAVAIREVLAEPLGRVGRRCGRR